ncbi:MAG TPA: hypothetical protein VJ741_05705 [Solirubrobacteraceae bacterium]|nr:hypothetical protein [Solirubrobacteraceae bacterium]
MSPTRPRPPKDCGPQEPFAPYFANILPDTHREALRRASVIYLEECYDAIRSTPLDADFRETAIAEHLPTRFEPYYDGLFAKEWTTTVAIVGWKLAQEGRPKLACLAEELALNALIREAITQLEIHDQDSDDGAWGDFRDLAFEDEDFLYLFDPAFDGIEDDPEATEHLTLVGLPFAQWFKPFSAQQAGLPHPFCLG